MASVGNVTRREVRDVKWLAPALAALVWTVGGFAAKRLLEVACPSTEAYFNDVANAVAVRLLIAVWMAVGVVVYFASDAARAASLWLVAGVPFHSTGEADRTGMFAALAGFALAQGVALTAVAKGEGRDWIVISIYVAVVIFSYLWTRQVLLTGEKEAFFDTTTLIQARYTLAWIICLGSVMTALGMYSLLPNQKWRELYRKTGAITCTTVRANNYASNDADADIQKARKWIKWASSDTSLETYWIESAAGFDASYRTFDVLVDHVNRFQINDLVAFLRRQDTPASLPTYRQLTVREPTTVNGGWSITVENPNLGDHVVIICKAKDAEVSVVSEKSVDPQKSFWLQPVFSNGTTEGAGSKVP
jgi:hypothetical protein